MKTIYIGALPFKSDEQTIRKLLEPYGPMGPVRLFADWVNPTGEPYALAEVERPEEAIENLDGYKIGSSHLRVHLKGGV